MERPRVAGLGREALVVAARDHGTQRVRVHGEHHEHVHQREAHQREHEDEVPPARPHEPAEERGQRGQGHRLPDRQPAEDEQGGDQRHGEVGQLLQGVVLPLARVVAAREEVELRHLPGVARVAAAGHQVSPLAVQPDPAQVHQPVDHQHPHHGEVPVAGSRQPPAEGEPVRDGDALPGPAAELLAAAGEARVGVEDPQPRAHHHHDRHDADPVRHPDHRVVPLGRHRPPPSEGRSGGGCRHRARGQQPLSHPER